MQELEESNGTLTLKQWIERTNAIGITTLPGRYGGTYAARTLADDFEMWISPKYRYYAFQRNRNSFAKWIEDFEHTKDMEKQTGKNVDQNSLPLQQLEKFYLKKEANGHDNLRIATVQFSKVYEHR